MLLFQLYKKRKIMQGRGKSGKQALNLTEEMVYEMNRSGHRLTLISSNDPFQIWKR